MSVFRTARMATAASVVATALFAGVPGTALAAQDLNCADFTTQEEAQAVYGADPSDPHGLACESLPHAAAPEDPAPAEPPPVDEPPVDEPPVLEDSPVPAEPVTPESTDPVPALTGPVPVPVVSTPEPAAPAQPALADRDCSDFSSPADAQAALDADRSDPDRLDADRDGLACEALFGNGQQQVGIHPTGGVATGTEAPSGGNGVLGLLAAGLLAGAGMIGRRRAQRN
jgi:hypothetical protein